jgi:hypothetical protein
VPTPFITGQDATARLTLASVAWSPRTRSQCECHAHSMIDIKQMNMNSFAVEASEIEQEKGF